MLEESVLVVEDDRLVRSALARLLKHTVRLVQAASVREGLDALGEISFGAFIIDVSLPDGSGLDVLSRARTRGSRAPALVLTASTSSLAINDAFDLGASYVVKPFDPDRVVRFVTEALAPSGRRLIEVVATWRARYRLAQEESEIILAFAEGSSYEEICAERMITMLALRRKVDGLLEKTGDPMMSAAVERLLRERR